MIQAVPSVASQLLNVYGNIVPFSFVKNISLIISVRNVSLFSEPHTEQSKPSWTINHCFCNTSS